MSNQIQNIAQSGSAIRPNPDVIAQRMEAKMVLLHLRTNRFYELNGTAARIWELLVEGYDLDQIQDQMFIEFEVDPEQLASQLGDLIDSLKSEELVEVS